MLSLARLYIADLRENWVYLLDKAIQATVVIVALALIALGLRMAFEAELPGAK